MAIIRQSIQSHAKRHRRLVALCVVLALMAAMPMTSKTAEGQAPSDDRWEIYFFYDPPEEGFRVRSVDHGGFITALPAADGYNVVTAGFTAAA